MPTLNSLKEAFKELIVTPTRKERMAYLRSVPITRLLIMLLAAFSLFTAIGLMFAITSSAPQRYLAVGFLSAVYVGTIGSLYTLVTTRKPILTAAVLAIQLATMPLLRLASIWLQRHQTPISFEAAARWYAPCAVFLIALSCSMFLRFIQTEGRFAFRAQTELALASEIQTTLVPVIDLKIAECEVYGFSLPSERVGGDLVDAVSLPGGGGFAYLTDIAGHGLNAGILMGMLKTAVRTCLVDDSTPGTLFDTLNRVLPCVKQAHMYATGVAFRVRRCPDGRCDILFAMAGHPPVLHLSASGQVKTRLFDEQFPLGLLPFEGYRSQCVETEAGDLLIAATDGILETCSKDGVEFGAEGLEIFAAQRAALPLAALAQDIFAAAKEIGPQEDDRTLLLIRIL